MRHILDWAGMSDIDFVGTGIQSSPSTSLGRICLYQDLRAHAYESALFDVLASGRFDTPVRVGGTASKRSRLPHGLGRRCTDVVMASKSFDQVGSVQEWLVDTSRRSVFDALDALGCIKLGVLPAADSHRVTRADVQRVQQGSARESHIVERATR